MKFLTALGLLLIPFLLSACGDEVFDYAYTASGEGNQESELYEDAQFSGTDDINVVIKLNSHDETVMVEARFIDSNKEVWQTIQQVADSDTGTVLMGIDYEARADQASQWTRGRHQIEIYVDGEKVETLYIQVN